MKSEATCQHDGAIDHQRAHRQFQARDQHELRDQGRHRAERHRGAGELRGGGAGGVHAVHDGVGKCLAEHAGDQRERDRVDQERQDGGMLPQALRARGSAEASVGARRAVFRQSREHEPGDDGGDHGDDRSTGASRPTVGDRIAPPVISAAAAAGPAIWPSVKPEVSVAISSIRSERLVRSAT